MRSYSDIDIDRKSSTFFFFLSIAQVFDAPYFCQPVLQKFSHSCVLTCVFIHEFVHGVLYLFPGHLTWLCPE